MTFTPTNIRTGLLLYADDVNTVMSSYTHIEVARSLTTDASELESVTDWAAGKASITAGNTGPYRLHDTVLELLLPDGSTLVHTFAGADPISATDAATELNNASALLDCTTDSGALVIRSADTGCEYALQVTGGDACHWLGLPYLTSGFGLTANVLLIADIVLYNFVDGQGSPDYTYRYRFVKETPPAYSEWMRPTAMGKELSLALDKLAVGVVTAAGLDGLGSAYTEVHVTNLSVPSDVSGTLVVGDQVKTLDASGQAAFPLVRGSKVEFYVVGTALHRTITVPDQAQFDMLDPSLVAEDPWGIVQTPYTSLPRTTL